MANTIPAISNPTFHPFRVLYQDFSGLLVLGGGGSRLGAGVRIPCLGASWPCLLGFCSGRGLALSWFHGASRRRLWRSPLHCFIVFWRERNSFSSASMLLLRAFGE